VTVVRVLILGGAGMLGHRLWRTWHRRFDVFVTVRKAASYYTTQCDLFTPERLMGGVDVKRTDDVLAAFAWSRPDVVINAVGIIKQLKESEDPLSSLEINALLPHRLALACRACGIRFIHISTDCVFSGKTGRYTEQSLSDAVDLYGRTKYLGEVHGEGSLTLRTSIIGREVETRLGLIEWFLAQRGGRCRGFSRAIFSGVTTPAFADLLADIIVNHPTLHGLYHVSSEPISKYDLLRLVNEVYQLGVTIEKDDEFVCDRSLDSTRFREATGWRPESWKAMILGMSCDSAPARSGASL
jgi:dTDP-4-dehydrorhamnose reductase